MLYFVYDLEASGINKERTDGVIYDVSTRIIEFGAVIYDDELKSTVMLMNELVKEDDFTEIEPEVEEVTGITTEMVKKYGISPKELFMKIKGFFTDYNIDLVVAHNGFNFDNMVMKGFFERNKLEGSFFFKPKQIDTLKDIEYPKSCRSKNLTYLAGYHGMLAGGHRAFFDANVTLEIMKRYNIENIIRRASSPYKKIIAKTKYEERNLPKKAGFWWDGENKVWYKILKECDFLIEKEDYNFNYTEYAYNPPKICSGLISEKNDKKVDIPF